MRDNERLVTLCAGCKTRLNALNARVGKNLSESHVCSLCEQLIGSHVTPFSATSGRSVRWQASAGRWQRISLCGTDIDHNFTPFQLSLFLPPPLPVPLVLIVAILSTWLRFASLPATLISKPETQSEVVVVVFFMSVKAFGPMTCHIHSLLIGVT